MASAFKIGTQAGGSGGVVTLDSLSIPDPLNTFQPYSNTAPLGDGTVRGLGFSSFTWSWKFITAAQRASLRNYCSGKSAKVYVRTYNDALTATTYLATMIWPDDEDVQAGRRLDFTLSFTHLE